MTKGEIEKAADDYAHNNFIMHHTNHFQALKQGFKAGALINQSQILEKMNQLQSESERLKSERETYARIQIEKDREDAKKDIAKVRKAIALMNSMITCGDNHSTQSSLVVKEAIEILDKMPLPINLD